MSVPESAADAEIMKQLLAGASLRTFMVPDDRIPSNSPEHIETYSLPHVLMHKDQFWGKSENTHISSNAEKDPLVPSSFIYTSIGELFCSYTPAISRGIFMSKKRYRIHRWVLKDDYKLIWDSAQGSDTAEVKTAIEQAARFKIALLDLNDVWHLHPIDLPMFFPQSRHFSIKVAYDIHPAAFRDFQQLNQFYEEHRDFFENSLDVKAFKAENYHLFYDIASRGKYRSFYDLQANSRSTYKHLKLYADRP